MNKTTQFLASLTLISLLTTPVEVFAQMLQPERNPVPTATSGPQSFGGGWAEASADLSRNGTLTVNTHARSDSCGRATRGSATIAGYDRQNNMLFVSRKFDMSTASSKCDFWSRKGDETRDLFTENIGKDIAPYISSLRVHVYQNDGPDLGKQLIGNIKSACETYDHLPTTARAAIAVQTGFPGCNPPVATENTINSNGSNSVTQSSDRQTQLTNTQSNQDNSSEQIEKPAREEEKQDSFRIQW